MRKLFQVLLITQILINLIGALGPELGFDALWYHLTEANLFLQNRSLNPIPGSLLYWSGLPRLGEIIYALGLLISPLLPKLIHWAFGVFCAYLIYKLAGLAAALLFYSTGLVGWLSTTAYVDLTMTAFLLLAVKLKSFWGRGVAIILASASKLHALVYGLAISLVPWGILGVLPFSLINWKATGNPFYPFLENFGLEKEWFFNGFAYWLSRPLRLFFDPLYRLGPMILIIFIIALFLKKTFKLKLTLLAFFLWFLSPGTDFGRFALFPLGLMAVSSRQVFKYRLVIGLVLIQAIVGISGRAYANAKYLPLLLGRQTKAEFLAKNLKFYFGDFYDIDGYFSKVIRSTDKVLIYSIHNLYYVDFPYDHETWADPQTHYTHILVGANAELPAKHGVLPLLYQNPTTQVKLYLNETD